MCGNVDGGLNVTSACRNKSSGAGSLPQDSLGKCIATVYVCYACGYNLICMALAVLVLFVINFVVSAVSTFGNKSLLFF